MAVSITDQLMQSNCVSKKIWLVSLPCLLQANRKKCNPQIAFTTNDTYTKYQISQAEMKTLRVINFGPFFTPPLPSYSI
jgi:hypothetical protein